MSKINIDELFGSIAEFGEESELHGPTGPRILPLERFRPGDSDIMEVTDFKLLLSDTQRDGCRGARLYAVVRNRREDHIAVAGLAVFLRTEDGSLLEYASIGVGDVFRNNIEVTSSFMMRPASDTRTKLIEVFGDVSYRYQGVLAKAELEPMEVIDTKPSRVHWRTTPTPVNIPKDMQLFTLSTTMYAGYSWKYFVDVLTEAKSTGVPLDRVTITAQLRDCKQKKLAEARGDVVMTSQWKTDASFGNQQLSTHSGHDVATIRFGNITQDAIKAARHLELTGTGYRYQRVFLGTWMVTGSPAATPDDSDTPDQLH